MLHSLENNVNTRKILESTMPRKKNSKITKYMLKSNPLVQLFKKKEQ